MTAEFTRGTSQHVTKREAQAAARARVTADRRLKRDTPDWILELAKSGKDGRVRPDETSKKSLHRG